jgi:putative transcriptional regulator
MSATAKKAGKVPSKRIAKLAVKRDLFAELGEGFAALAASRTGKQTLRTHVVEVRPSPTIKAKDLASLRKKLDVSRPILAGYLRTNVRTLENWEQGRAKPNAQAALLIKLVAAYPDTVKKLASL